MIKKLVLVLLLLCPITSMGAGAYCSAFFISEDGYIGTAGHCTNGSPIIATYTKDGLTVQQIARLVAVDKIHDVAILKIKEHNMPYYSFNTFAIVGDKGTLWGWPDVYTFGYSLKHFSSTIVSIDDNYIYVYSFIAPGMSGGVLLDNEGKAEGVTVMGDFDEGSREQTSEGIISRIKFLQDLMIGNGIVSIPNWDAPSQEKMIFLDIENITEE